jgi:hypothetical protein
MGRTDAAGPRRAPGTAPQLVALTVGGRYLRLSERDGETRLRADTAAVDAAGAFERLDLGHGRIALRTVDGRHLARRPDPRQNFGLYPQPDLTAEAVFEEVLWPDGQVSLRCADLTFVGVDLGAGHTVTANRVEAGPTERFAFVPVAPAAVPAQRAPAAAAHPTLPV